MSLGIPRELKREALRILDELADGNPTTLRSSAADSHPRTVEAVRHLQDKSAYWYEGGTTYRLTANAWDYRYQLKHPVRYWVRHNIVAAIAIAALAVSIAGIVLD